jgi:hypothetical protein
MKADEILSSAAMLVSGDRARQHGDKEQNFSHIAAYWNVFIAHKEGARLTAADVCKMMSLLKLARMESGEFNQDDAVDCCGYAGMAGELASLTKRR